MKKQMSKQQKLDEYFKMPVTGLQANKQVPSISSSANTPIPSTSGINKSLQIPATSSSNFNAVMPLSREINKYIDERQQIFLNNAITFDDFQTFTNIREIIEEDDTKKYSSRKVKKYMKNIYLKLITEHNYISKYNYFFMDFYVQPKPWLTKSDKLQCKKYKLNYKCIVQMHKNNPMHGYNTMYMEVKRLQGMSITSIKKRINIKSQGYFNEILKNKCNGDFDKAVKKFDNIVKKNEKKCKKNENYLKEKYVTNESNNCEYLEHKTNNFEEIAEFANTHEINVPFDNKNDSNCEEITKISNPKRDVNLLKGIQKIPEISNGKETNEICNNKNSIEIPHCVENIEISNCKQINGIENQYDDRLSNEHLPSYVHTESKYTSYDKISYYDNRSDELLNEEIRRILPNIRKQDLNKVKEKCRQRLNNLVAIDNSEPQFFQYCRRGNYNSKKGNSTKDLIYDAKISHQSEDLSTDTNNAIDMNLTVEEFLEKTNIIEWMENFIKAKDPKGYKKFLPFVENYAYKFYLTKYKTKQPLPTDLKMIDSKISHNNRKHRNESDFSTSTCSNETVIFNPSHNINEAQYGKKQLSSLNMHCKDNNQSKITHSYGIKNPQLNITPKITIHSNVIVKEANKKLIEPKKIQDKINVLNESIEYSDTVNNECVPNNYFENRYNNEITHKNNCESPDLCSSESCENFENRIEKSDVKSPETEKSENTLEYVQTEVVNELSESNSRRLKNKLLAKKMLEDALNSQCCLDDDNTLILSNIEKSPDKLTNQKFNYLENQESETIVLGIDENFIIQIANYTETQGISLMQSSPDPLSTTNTQNEYYIHYNTLAEKINNENNSSLCNIIVSPAKNILEKEVLKEHCKLEDVQIKAELLHLKYSEDVEFIPNIVKDIILVNDDNSIDTEENTEGLVHQMRNCDDSKENKNLISNIPESQSLIPKEIGLTYGTANIINQNTEKNISKNTGITVENKKYFNFAENSKDVTVHNSNSGIIKNKDEFCLLPRRKRKHKGQSETISKENVLSAKLNENNVGSTSSNLDFNPLEPISQKLEQTTTGIPSNYLLRLKRTLNQNQINEVRLSQQSLHENDLKSSNKIITPTATQENIISKELLKDNCNSEKIKIKTELLDFSQYSEDVEFIPNISKDIILIDDDDNMNTEEMIHQMGIDCDLNLINCSKIINQNENSPKNSNTESKSLLPKEDELSNGTKNVLNESINRNLSNNKDITFETNKNVEVAENLKNRKLDAANSDIMKSKVKEKNIITGPKSNGHKNKSTKSSVVKLNSNESFAQQTKHDFKPLEFISENCTRTSFIKKKTNFVQPKQQPTKLVHYNNKINNIEDYSQIIDEFDQNLPGVIDNYLSNDIEHTCSKDITEETNKNVGVAENSKNINLDKANSDIMKSKVKEKNIITVLGPKSIGHKNKSTKSSVVKLNSNESFAQQTKHDFKPLEFISENCTRTSLMKKKTNFVQPKQQPTKLVHYNNINNIEDYSQIIEEYEQNLPCVINCLSSALDHNYSQQKLQTSLNKVKTSVEITSEANSYSEEIGNQSLQINLNNPTNSQLLNIDITFLTSSQLVISQFSTKSYNNLAVPTCHITENLLTNIQSPAKQIQNYQYGYIIYLSIVKLNFNRKKYNKLLSNTPFLQADIEDDLISATIQLSKNNTKKLCLKGTKLKCLLGINDTSWSDMKKILSVIENFEYNCYKPPAKESSLLYLILYYFFKNLPKFAQITCDIKSLIPIECIKYIHPCKGPIKNLSKSLDNRVLNSIASKNKVLLSKCN